MQHCSRVSVGAGLFCRGHTLAKAFPAWRANASAKAGQRELLQRTAATILHSRLARAFRHWRGWAGRSGLLQAKARSVVEAMLLRTQVGGGALYNSASSSASLLF